MLGEKLIGTPLFPGTVRSDQMGWIMSGLPMLNREEKEFSLNN